MSRATTGCLTHAPPKSAAWSVRPGQQNPRSIDRDIARLANAIKFWRAVQAPIGGLFFCSSKKSVGSTSKFSGGCHDDGRNCANF
jgi:hypothetical protein